MNATFHQGALPSRCGSGNGFCVQFNEMGESLPIASVVLTLNPFFAVRAIVLFSTPVSKRAYLGLHKGRQDS